MRVAVGLMTVPLTLLWALGPLRAQDVTGSLEGRVVTGSGDAIEGAAVTAEAATLQGRRSVTTDAAGHFTFPSLPAGSYTVRVQRIGYGPLRVEDVPVRLGSTSSLGNLRLAAQAVEMAEVVVSGAKPVIDPASPATRTTIDSSQFLALPSERDFRALLPFVPQANASWYPEDGVNVTGGTGMETAYYVDGMNVKVNRAGSMSIPFNFVRELQVAAGGYEAEYGRALTGVVNVVTPSGSNEFHGQAVAYYAGSGLRTAPRVGLEESNPVNARQYDVGLSLSGPIVRDRLWYFAAYDPTFAKQDVLLAGLPKQRDSQVRHLFAGKVTWRAGPQTDLEVTVLGDPSRHDTLAQVLPSTVDPAAAVLRVTQGGTTMAIQARHQFDARTRLSITASRLAYDLNTTPRSGDTSLLARTRINDRTTNVSSGGPGRLIQNRETRPAVRLALSLLRGGHAVKVGAEYEDDQFTLAIGPSVITRVADSTYNWLELFTSAHVHNRIPTLYAQDTWEVARRLSVSFGLRWEGQYLSGQVGPDRTIAPELAPRLGVVYELGEPGSQRVFASAGRFFEELLPITVASSNGSGTGAIRVYPQNPLVDSANGTVKQGLNTPAGFPATADLVGQYYDQLTVGYERRLGGGFKLGAHGTYRILRWVLEDGIAPGDSVIRFGNPGRGPLATMPRARQHYEALEFSLERSTPGPLYLLASYVLSRNTGNYTGLYVADQWSTDGGSGPFPNSGPQYDYPDQLVNADGLLPNDQTHVAKAAVSFRTRAGATLGAFLTVASGTPLSEYGTSAALAPYWTFVSPRGSAGRTPTTWSLDLHSAYDLPVSGRGRVHSRLLVDLFDVGSPRSAVQYDQLQYLDSARTQVNPNYLAVMLHQPPMSARVGVEVGF